MLHLSKFRQKTKTWDYKKRRSSLCSDDAQLKMKRVSKCSFLGWNSTEHGTWTFACKISHWKSEHNQKTCNANSDATNTYGRFWSLWKVNAHVKVARQTMTQMIWFPPISTCSVQKHIGFRLVNFLFIAIFTHHVVMTIDSRNAQNQRRKIQNGFHESWSDGAHRCKLALLTNYLFCVSLSLKQWVLWGFLFVWFFFKERNCILWKRGHPSADTNCTEDRC